MDELFVENAFGYCFYELVCETYDNKPLIYNLYVYPEHRMHGEATHLLRLAISAIRDSGYAGEIVVEVQPRENSISVEKLSSFYESNGLTCVSVL